MPEVAPGWTIASAEAPERPRRRVWPWIVGAAALLVVILVGGVLAIETVVRTAVQGGIADRVRSELGLPPDHPVDVSIPGLLTPQLVAGSLGELQIASDAVELEQLTVDATVTLRDVSVSEPYTMSGGTAVVELDESQLAELAGAAAQIEILELALAEPAVVVSTELALFGIGVPISLSLIPSADGGELLLRADTLQLSGLTVSAEQVQAQFGAIAEPLLREWPVCVAQYLPAGAVLSAAAVTGDDFVLTFDIRGDLLSDPTLQQNGTCS